MQAIIENLIDELHIDRDRTAASWTVLRDIGNMSSASVLFVMNEERKRPMQPLPYHMSVAFGPGLSVEAGLMRRLR